MSTSTKRPRTQSSSRSSSNSSTTATSPPPKSSRTIPTSQTSDSDSTVPESHPLLCTLPPTCHRRPTPIAHSRDLEAHYAKYHAHVCEESGCGCVFPDERLLDLHQTECHDTLAAIRKERGEKIFACHLATCPKFFATPKTRRLHLIQAHGFPKEYFFAVTNKGIGGLLKKWGDGASLIRGQWKPRDGGVKQEGQGIDAKNNSKARSGSTGDDSDDSDDEPTGDATESEEMEVDARDHDDQANATPKASAKDAKPLEDDAMDTITSELSALSLIPSSVRFGQGGKMNGFGRPNNGARPPATSGNTKPAAATSNNLPADNGVQHSDDQHHRQRSATGSESAQEHPHPRGRGRGRGGRGSGFVHTPTNTSGGIVVDKSNSSNSMFTVIDPASRGGRGVINLGEYRGNPRGRGRGRGRARGS